MRLLSGQHVHGLFISLVALLLWLSVLPVLPLSVLCTLIRHLEWRSDKSTKTWLAKPRWQAKARRKAAHIRFKRVVVGYRQSIQDQHICAALASNITGNASSVSKSEFVGLLLRCAFMFSQVISDVILCICYWAVLR